ncbi:MAG: acetone carboxylase subunit gamma, partial [SAR324 cluster bacterium]
SDILSRFEAGRMPEGPEEIEGKAVTLQLRQQNFIQRPEDVYAVRWCGGGGFGDPLERDPMLVARDFEQLSVTARTALDVYGVVINAETGEADLPATEALRDRTRAERVARSDVPCTRKVGKRVLLAMEHLAVMRNGGESFLACPKCNAYLGGVADNYKDFCIREERPVSAANPLIGDPARFIDDPVVFRQFFCPGCGRLLENEVALKDDPLLHDVRLEI